MKKVLILFLLLLTFSQTISYAQLSKNHVEWTENKLTWNDFQGKMKKKSPYDALTLSAIYSAYKTDESQKNIILVVKAVFDKKGSKKKKNNTSSHLLNHEQRHFDITEIYARILKKNISEIEIKQLNTISSKFNAEINKNFNEWKKFQNLYDKETNHSTNKEKQMEWDEKIDNLLIDYEYYKNPEIIISIEGLK